ncbi:MAG: cyclohexanecarboxylate-CoA ligase [Rhodospirillaceae bacterium]|nr:MAG: cyclohexanecarboxylate-CoA ligase [Rhodospirillaceae bacterium]
MTIGDFSSGSAPGTRRDPIGRDVRFNRALATRWRSKGYWLDTTLAALTEDLAASDGDRVMAIEGERCFTVAEILIESRRLANALLERGLGLGSVISYQIPNWYEGCVINLAASMIGGVVNPLVPIYRDNELTFMLDDVKARVVFVPESFRNCDYAAMMLRVRKRLNHDLEIVVLRGAAEGCLSYSELLSAGITRRPLPRVDPDSVYVMMHTSGSTGRPKCVLHSHNTFLVQGRVHALELRRSQSDVQIVASPISHVSGMILANLTPVVGGAKIVLMDRWSAAAAIDLIHQHDGTALGGATPFLRQLVDAARAADDHLPTLTCVGTGGAAVPPDLIREAQDWFPNAVSYRIYGCTEVPTITSGTNSRADMEHGAETDGRIRHVEIRIVDPVSGAALPTDAEGEILACGPQMMLGYLRMEDNDGAFDADGYFRTGDLGRIVDNEYILITGRKKDLIIRSGENLSPKEIEDVLHTHPAVSSAAVVGMPHPRSGECVCAFLVVCEGHSIDLLEIDRFLCNAGLSRQKVPEHVEIVESLPTSVQGKVLKAELRKIAAKISHGLRHDLTK